MKTVFSYGLALTLLSTTISPSRAYDVRGNGDRFIKVDLSEDRAFASFQVCKTDRPNLCFALDGSAIEYKKFTTRSALRFYSLSELQKQRGTEKYQIPLSVLGDVGVGALLIFVAGNVGSAVAMKTAVAVPSLMSLTTIKTGTIAGAIGGGAGTYAITNAVDGLNPAKQYRQYRILKNDVLFDTEVALDADIRDYIQSLNSILAKLNP